MPVFSDRFLDFTRFFEEEHNEKGTKKSFTGIKSLKRIHRSTRANQKTNPYAVEPIINVGAWTFEPLDKNGTLLLSYYICSHPGGSVPVALQSIATEKNIAQQYQRYTVGRSKAFSVIVRCHTCKQIKFLIKSRLTSIRCRIYSPLQ